MATDNLAIWHAVEKTDPWHTKGFSRGGGFKGTAVSPMYLIQKATTLWGPMGKDWGVRIVKEQVLQGSPLLSEAGALLGHESVHAIQIELFYPGGSIPGIGQTQLVGRNKYGFFTDEEAPKKSLTDALTKALSWLGFAADVHMGLYDDVKYVADLKKEFSQQQEPEKKQPQEDAKLRDTTLVLLNAAAIKGTASLEAAWKSLAINSKTACKSDLEGLKKRAAEADVKLNGAREAVTA